MSTLFTRHFFYEKIIELERLTAAKVVDGFLNESLAVIDT